MSGGIAMPDTVTAEDLFHLEESFKDDLACQLNHDLIGLPCSVAVTALGTACTMQVRLCEVARIVIIGYMNAGGDCLWCDKKAADCWVLTPVGGAQS